MGLPQKPVDLVSVCRHDAAFMEEVVSLHSDRRNLAVIDIAATFAILAALIAMLVRYPGPWTSAIAFVGIGLMQYRIVIACHEAVHRALLYPLWLNETVGSIHCALVGINLLWYRYQHVAHHAARDVGHDPDAYIYKPILQARPGVPRLAVWIFGTAFEVVEKLRQKGFTVSATLAANAKARFYSFAIVAVQGALFVSCALWLSWWYYLAFWLAPLLTIAIFMNRTRVLVEHGFAHVARPENSTLNVAPVEAVDISAGYIERFLIAPYSMNYHFAHHRMPSIPFHRNADLAQLLEQRGEVVPFLTRPTYARALYHLLWT